MAAFDSLLASLPWEEIPGCPGRFRLRPGALPRTPAQLVGSGVTLRELRSARARDPIVLALLPGGALLSYRRPDGAFVHTLNTPAGLRRKLQQLGLEAEVPGEDDAPA